MRYLLAGLAAVIAVAAANPAANPHHKPMQSRSGACTAADSNAVTVVIDYQDLGGGTHQYCASGLRAGATGLDALQAVASVQGTTSNGQSVACRINSRPGASQVLTLPGDVAYTESCVNMPPAAAYWSYWWADAGGSWTYSTQGLAARKVKFGSYEGWSFALGAGFGHAPQPRVTPAVWDVPPPVTTPQPSPPMTSDATNQPPLDPNTQPAKTPSANKPSANRPQTSQPVVSQPVDEQPSSEPPASPATSPTPATTAASDDSPAPPPVADTSTSTSPAVWWGLAGLIAAVAAVLGWRYLRHYQDGNGTGDQDAAPDETG